MEKLPHKIFCRRGLATNKSLGTLVSIYGLACAPLSKRRPLCILWPCNFSDRQLYLWRRRSPQRSIVLTRDATHSHRGNYLPTPSSMHMILTPIKPIISTENRQRSSTALYSAVWSTTNVLRPSHSLNQRVRLTAFETRLPRWTQSQGYGSEYISSSLI